MSKEVHMKNQTNAQIDALNRMMYMLEEGSIGRLMEHDVQFEAFIGKLYDKLQFKAAQLQR